MTENTVAVLGGGFGGLRAALSLARDLKRHRLTDRYKVILVNRTDYHLYTPLLYKYAAMPDFPRAALALPLAGLIAGTNIQLIVDTLSGLDLTAGVLKLTTGREVKAGYIILAPGSETNWFGISGIEENALTLKTLEDAEKIRAGAQKLQAGARILVGGGGPTGIELAAELRQARGFNVTIVEAMPALLPGFAPSLQKGAAKRLARLGVEVLLNEPVSEVRPGSAKTKGGKELNFDLFVWTGGVQVPGWVKGLPLKKETRGRLESSIDMECAPAEPVAAAGASVYAIGDADCVHFRDGTPVPPVARAAIQEAQVAAENIIRDILFAEGVSKSKEHSVYHPMHYPYVLPIGGRYAIGNIGPLILRGLPAWLFKEAIEVNYLLSILPPGAAFRVWRKAV